MLLLVIGLIVFFGIHLLPANQPLRDGLARRMGAVAYMGMFSLVSVLGLALIGLGYHKLQLMPGKNPVLWELPDWMRHVTLALMLPAFIFIVAAYIPSRIRTTLGHPMLIAIALWALAHLLSNGDLASLVLFGSFLVYGIFDRISAAKRMAMGPLGNAQPGSIINDIIVVVVGVGLYYIFLKWGHPALIGVSIIPA